MAKAKSDVIYYERKTNNTELLCNKNGLVVQLTRWQSEQHGIHYVLYSREIINGEQIQRSDILTCKLCYAVRRAVAMFDHLFDRHPNKEEME